WIGSRHAQQIMMAVSAIAGAIVLVPQLVRLKPDATPGMVRQKLDATPGMVRLKPDATNYGVLSPTYQRVAVVIALAFAVTLIRRVPPISPMLVAHGRFAATLLGQAGDIIYVGEGLQSSVAV